MLDQENDGQNSSNVNCNNCIANESGRKVFRLCEEHQNERGNQTVCRTDVNMDVFSCRRVMHRFSTRKTNMYVPLIQQSETINVNRQKDFLWRLKVYPFGRGKENKDFVSMFFVLSSGHGTITAKGSITIMDITGQIIWSKELNTSRKFYMRTEWGEPQCIARSELLPLIKNKRDMIVVHCVIETPSAIRTRIMENESFCDLPAVTKYVPIEGLSNLLYDDRYKDVKLLVEGKVFEGHKVVLAAQSQVFSDIIDTPPNEDGEIPVDGISHDMFKKLLHYIYTGQVINFKELLKEYLEASMKFELKQLQESCELEFMNRVTFDTASEIKTIAESLKSEKLLKYINTFTQSAYDFKYILPPVRQNKIQPPPADQQFFDLKGYLLKKKKKK